MPEQNNDIDQLAMDVFQWADSVFPGRTDNSMYVKIFEELGEVIRSDGDRLEVADIFILLLDYAKRKNINLGAAIREKLGINENREWKINRNGTMSHSGPPF